MTAVYAPVAYATAAYTPSSTYALAAYAPSSTYAPAAYTAYMTDACFGTPSRVVRLDPRGIHDLQKAVEASPTPFAVVDTEGFCVHTYTFNRKSPKHLAVRWVTIYALDQVAYIRFNSSTERAIANFLQADFPKLFWGISEDAKRLPPIRNARDIQVEYAAHRCFGNRPTSLAKAVNELECYHGAVVLKSPFHHTREDRSAFYRGFLGDTLTPLHVKYMVADVVFIRLVQTTLLSDE